MEIKIVQETCCNCGIAFWIDAKFQARLIETKQSFHCPNGHGMHYLGESDAAKLSRIRREKDAEIESLKKQLEKKKRKPRSKKTP